MPSEAAERAAVCAEALTWEGTAMHHMGQCKIRRGADGAVIDRGGVDCGYSMVLIYHAALPHRVPALDLGYYSETWNLSKTGAEPEPYLAVVLGLEHAREIAAGAARPGDLALFRFGLAWAHGAVVMPPGWPAIMHASGDARAFVRDRGDDGRLRRRPVRFFTFWPAAI